MELTRAAGRTISFDPNLRPTLWASPERMREAINGLAARADWVLPGIEEGLILTGERTPEGVAHFYRERGAKLVVVKLGPEAPTTTATRAPAASGSRWSRSSTPWAPATASRPA